MDIFEKKKRSEVMSKVKSKDTGAEMTVRRLLHLAGFRYRLHRKDLPGKPDIVFPGRKKVVFVHGCFWHQHADCRRAQRPQSNKEYWNKKLDRNQERDAANESLLIKLGWEVFIVWECRLKNRDALLEDLKVFLSTELRTVEL